jgi:hypothetical protein
MEGQLVISLNINTSIMGQDIEQLVDVSHFRGKKVAVVKGARGASEYGDLFLMNWMIHDVMNDVTFNFGSTERGSGSIGGVR